MIISAPPVTRFKDLLLDGSNLESSFPMRNEANPDGLAQAFSSGEEFIGDGSVALILGDNIYRGPGLSKCFKKLTKKEEVRQCLATSEGSRSVLVWSI